MRGPRSCFGSKILLRNSFFVQSSFEIRSNQLRSFKIRSSCRLAKLWNSFLKARLHLCVVFVFVHSPFTAGRRTKDSWRTQRKREPWPKTVVEKDQKLWSRRTPRSNSDSYKECCNDCSYDGNRWEDQLVSSCWEDQQPRSLLLLSGPLFFTFKLQHCTGALVIGNWCCIGSEIFDSFEWINEVWIGFVFNSE